MNAWLHVVAAMVVAALVSPPSPDAETLAVARELYASADYEQSLALLDKLQAPAGTEDARGVALYRAYCLLALGRGTEAEQAIVAVVSSDPLYRPADNDASPRIVGTFRDVRRRTLPGIVQTRYAAAKASFDSRQFAEASKQFTEVLAMISDPDLGAAATESPLADLRVLAIGFRDLSVQSTPPPPLPARVREPEVAAAVMPVSAPPAPAAARIYTADDHLVSPPVPVAQAIPNVIARPGGGGTGVLEVTVDESGAVESAVMRVPINAIVDRAIVDAAKKWQYEPARREGAPVKFRKLVQISVK